jgi:riboflavin synthase
MASHLKKFIALKGSICINGVSLTVGKISAASFDIYLIPFTLKETNLGLLKPGDQVNIEIDILARYILNKNN